MGTLALGLQNTNILSYLEDEYFLTCERYLTTCMHATFRQLYSCATHAFFRLTSPLRKISDDLHRCLDIDLSLEDTAPHFHLPPKPHSYSKMMKPPRALQGLTPETLNSTDPLDLPSKLLEQFLPGFSVLRRFLIASLGFDITLLVTTCLLLVASVTSLRYAGRSILSFGQSWLTATVTINSSDKLYEEVMQWIAKQTLTEDARMLSASTKMGAKAGRHGERTTMGLGAWGASSRMFDVLWCALWDCADM